MKLSSPSVLCLLLLFHTHFSLGMKGGGSSGKSSSPKKPSTSSHGSSHTNTNTGHRHNEGSDSDKQHGPPSQGGNSQGRGDYGVHGGGRGGSHGGHGGHGRGHKGQGSYGGGYGSYGGGYINQNPNNQILSPHYRSRFGHGGRGEKGGSPFSRSVHEMGMFPSEKSKEYGRSAARATAGGSMASMALGYGIGRFPRPHFQFQSPEEDYYYNHYMYRKYGVRSTDTDDYSRDYEYSRSLETYDNYMGSCMNRTDLLPEQNQQTNNKPVPTTTTSVPTAPINGTGNNSTAADNSSTSTLHHLKQPEVKLVSPTAEIPGGAAADNDDTVSIVAIGYPALIKQMKIRKCLELYVVHSEKYLGSTGGASRLAVDSKLLLAVFSSTILVLLNSNMLHKGSY